MIYWLKNWWKTKIEEALQSPEKWERVGRKVWCSGRRRRSEKRKGVGFVFFFCNYVRKWGVNVFYPFLFHLSGQVKSGLLIPQNPDYGPWIILPPVNLSFMVSKGNVLNPSLYKCYYKPWNVLWLVGCVSRCPQHLKNFLKTYPESTNLIHGQ